MTTTRGQAADRPGEDENLVASLAWRIEHAILSGRYPIGGWLRQARLAEEFAVSRTPVREALRRLEMLGLVELVPNKGALVRGPVLREVRETYQIRGELEALAAQLATANVSGRQLDRLRTAEDRLRRASDRLGAGPRGDDAGESEWVAAADEFHDIVLEMSGNQRLRWAVDTLTATWGRSLTLMLLEDDRRTELFHTNMSEHERVREALEQRDPEAARAAMQQHLQSVAEAVLRSLERYATVQM